jgi:hypothetical protein
MTAVVCNSDLFIPMSTALAMLNSSLVNETVGLNELLLKNMNSYLRLSGLFEFNIRDGEGVKSKLTYASGLCLATIGTLKNTMGVI